MGVFANGLEISGKAVDAKTIAAMPDTCFTPPEAPPTPTGVPIPYPSFGMAGDTDKGTGTVKIGGKTVNIKNKSHLTKTTGTEAGSAAKKGIVTSKNTGKEQFNSWSNDVKFDGEPVIRNTDLATNNHASPAGNTPPWVHIAKLSKAGGDCEKVYQELEGHPHGKSPCNYSKTGKQSEHTARASALMHTRKSNKACTNFPNYDQKKAPCICMEAKRMKKKKKEPSIKGMPHYNKTKKIDDFLDKGRAGCKSGSKIKCSQNCKVPTVGALAKKSADATVEEHPKTKSKAKKKTKKQKQVSECLELINLTYVAGVTKDDTPAQARKKVAAAKKKKICTKGICRAPKSKKCHGC
ncbi:DUF4150 domain-containing protein [Cognatiyoonia sp. IB215182]|uniref:DUF4150 domain-containing protein n=1 Tax=Cognatiyoonia sp. IB215182 TaxID=3097353 RepID=UPI002A178553|nr:DUF4150 domain-containing protein [Cognatiyoonia sp. IB215182]MDX8352713.1 DUF4150 domain-containing protein [Cognatiyoonia sp. IB215182]